MTRSVSYWRLSHPSELLFRLATLHLATLFTIGHSTRPSAELIAALQAHEIQTVVDIRAFPMSRRLPQFNRDSLEKSMPAAGIAYLWMKALGGYRRKVVEESANVALRNASFRNYADYMLTAEFEAAAVELVALARRSRTAYMCAERMYFRCHRMLVSDWIVARGHEVLHIDGTGPARSHHLTAEARMLDGQLLYRGDRLL
jgi:uncharacterized protein (DUF488 family)